jgi:hypothetical protein
MHDDEGKTIVIKENELIPPEDFSLIESAIFFTNENYVDTFNFTPEQFPNLKSASLWGLFYDQLVGISKFKDLQYLDLGSLYYSEHMLYSYTLNFPSEFWSLKKLQILHVYTSQLSDLSENIIRLESLKVLNLASYDNSYAQLILPWSLLLMPNLALLNIGHNLNQEELELFKTHAHFKVTDDSYKSTISQLLPDDDIREIFQKDRSHKKINNEIILRNDSLELRIPLNTTDSSIEGTAILANNGKTIQKRKYKSGLGHGKWIIQNQAGTQKRKYSHGKPIGRWVAKDPHEPLRNQSIHHKKNTPDHRVKGNPMTNPVYYKNFNHMFHFDCLRESIKDNS